MATLGILGVLAETDDGATIGAVHDTLQHNFGRYWGASTGVLGPTMTQLEERGHVELTVADEVGAYRITESGRDRLRSLLREPLEDLSSSPLQPALVLKFGYLHHLEPSAQRAEIDSLHDRLRTARDDLVDVKSSHDEHVSDDAETGYRGDLLLLRVFVLDAIADWLDELEVDRAATQ
jgi:DNA-binding PadR family transcriptional regulator